MSTRASAGTVIEGKYLLERELGAGGMGAVWLATQIMVDRKVAVKLLHPAFMDQDDLQARFEVEARAIGRLNHPNCITLYDFGFSNDLKAFYTVIEFVNGVSLDKRLSTKMPLTEVVSIVKHIALALDHAHHQGILHRDLKPENVMLAKMTDGSELVKVLDFGIARIVKGDNDNEEAQRITKAGEVFGTPAYMSPEQARSTRQLGPPADLYSLGVMFYELVSGKLPFFANSAFELLMMHVTKPVPPLERNDVPQEIKAIIYRLMDKEPANRFQSGRDLARALDAVLGLPSMTEEIAVQGTLPAPAPTLISSTDFEPRALETTSTSVSRPKIFAIFGFGVLFIVGIMAVIFGVSGPKTTVPDPIENPRIEPIVESVEVPIPPTETVVRLEDPEPKDDGEIIVEVPTQTNSAKPVPKKENENENEKPKPTTRVPKSTKKTVKWAPVIETPPKKDPKKKFESLSPTSDKKFESLSL